MNNEDMKAKWSKGFVAYTAARTAVITWAKEVKESEVRRETALQSATHWLARAVEEEKTAKAARAALEAAKVVETNAATVLAANSYPTTE